MEKEKTITCTRQKTLHYFYCDGDDCNKYLGQTEEYDDGYYPELGVFELEFHMPDGWYRVKKHLCNECKDKFLAKVKNTLTELGFEKE